MICGEKKTDVHDLDAMAVATQALLEVDEREVERAALVIVDKRHVQKVTPFGGQSPLILDLVLRCGLARLDRYPDVDAAGLALG